jgi:hydroxymethylbilane synthase
VKTVTPPTQLQSRNQPFKAGTRGSPLARQQTATVLELLRQACPAPDGETMFEEHIIVTTGDAVLNKPLAEIGGKGLFAKEIHESLAAGRIDFAVHSLKDLETGLPPGIVLACTLTREDPRDVLILPPGRAPASANDPLSALPQGAVVGSASVRRQAQLKHARPDLRFTLLRGNVGTRLGKIEAGELDATLLAYAGLRRLGLADKASLVLETEHMLPAACQGIVGITARETDSDLLALLAAIENPASKAVATAERALLSTLDGSCRTPIAGYATLNEDGSLHLTGLVARHDGSFLLRRDITGSAADAALMGRELGLSLKSDSPGDIFLP